VKQVSQLKPTQQKLPQTGAEQGSITPLGFTALGFLICLFAAGVARFRRVVS
jgi:hypothetical protein